MPKLYEKQSGKLLGEVTQDDVQLLIDQLEEEHRGDRDYFINTATIDLLESAGASDGLLHLLRGAVGGGEGLEVRYES